MKLEWIEYFVAIAKTESLTKTAEYFYLSQPTMSKAIRNLEEELGFELFVRKKTGMYLTAQGEQFFPYAEEIAKQYQMYRRNVLERSIDQLDEIEIAISPHLLQSYYEEVYQVLTRFAPKSKISIVDADNTKVREMIVDNPKMCGLVVADPVIQKLLKENNLKTISLYETPLVLCMSKTSRLAKKAHITPEDLNGDDILALSMDGTRRNVMLAKTILKTSNLSLLMNMLLSEKGICILPQKIAEKSFDNSNLIIRPVDFLDNTTIAFVYNEQMLHETAYSKFVLDKLSGELAQIFYNSGRKEKY